MANNFFTASGNPATGSQGSSASMRAEFESIEDGFDKLPALSGNGGKVVAVNSGGTALESIATTGSGSAVRATSPTLVTPILGTPQSGTLTNCIGLPISAGVAGLGTNVASALAVNVGTAGAVVVNGGVLGTPSSGTLSSCTGLPVAGVSGLGTGVGTALAVNVGSSGAFVTNGGALGTPSSGTVTNLTGTASININGTVGATTPNTGAFTTITASGVLKGPNGTAGAPTYSFSSSGNDDNGMYLSAANEVSVSTAGSKRLTVTSDGRLYGTALHNNAGSVTGTTNQYIASGTYTPTISNLSNVDAGSTVYSHRWMRVGNVVTVSGQIDVTSTNSGSCNFDFSLPIASDFSSKSQCAGGGAAFGFNTSSEYVPVYIKAIEGTVANISWYAINDGSGTLTYSFTYIIDVAIPGP